MPRSPVRIELSRDAVFAIVEELHVFMPWTIVPELWDGLTTARTAALQGQNLVHLTLTRTNAAALRRWLRAQRMHPDLPAGREELLKDVEAALAHHLGAGMR
jgi:hypothetical protein